MLIHILFVGLISFSQDGNGKSVHAFLLNAIGPQRASDGIEIPRHLAFVATWKPLVDDADCPDEANLKLLVGADKFCSWLLRHTDVTFGRVKGASSGSLCDPRTTTCPVVLTDERLIPETLALKDECLEPKPIDCSLAGRALVSTSKIEGVSFCDADIDFFPLRGAPTAMNQGKIADVAWAELTAEPDFLELHLKKFGSLTSGRTIRVWTNKGLPVNIIVGNLSQPHDQECSFSCTKETIGTDHHFEMYYGLAEQPPGAYRRPVPHACCRCDFIPPIPDWLKAVLKDIGVLHSPQDGEITMKGLSERIICPMSSF